jgi:hypothetical protein
MSNYLPVENDMENYWFCDEDELGTHQTTASLLEESDIVIIGAGFAGVATACHLLKGSSGNFCYNPRSSRSMLWCHRTEWWPYTP